jgi:Bifunctional DNA primase/polymerase, N-terminal
VKLEDVSCLHAALAFARRGLKVLPLHWPADDGKCSCARQDCTSPAKHPLTTHGLHDASADEDLIINWWRRWADANVGILTGDGLVVLDVDGDDGERSLKALQARGLSLADVPEVQTGRGRQFYFSSESPVGNSVRKLGPGLDIRGEGGYVVAPPSRHISGAVYKWVVRLPL